MLSVLTSIGFKRTERQQFCIKSWQKLDCKVIAVQSSGETKLLEQHYPNVEFVETSKVGDVFNHPGMVRISGILDQITTSPMLLLNSDIEIRSSREEFKRNWAVTADKELKMGIRWDEDPVTKKVSLLKYGIDAFLITPQIVTDLNDIGMTIGCPAWDYWIPIHLQRKGYSFDTSKRLELFHEDHPKNWSKIDFAVGVDLLKKHYRLKLREASNFIQKITDREGL